MSHREEIVDHLEPVITGGIVDTTDIHDTFELCRGVVLEEDHDGHDGRRCNIEGELVLPHTKAMSAATLIDRVMSRGEIRTKIVV